MKQEIRWITKNGRSYIIRDAAEKMELFEELFEKHSTYGKIEINDPEELAILHYATVEYLKKEALP